METREIILLIAFICNATVGIYVLAKNITSKVNVFFALLALQVAVWNLVNLLSFISVQESLIVLFTKLTLLTVLFIPSTVLIFAKLFIGEAVAPSRYWLFFVPSFIQIPFIFTAYNIAGFAGDPRGDNFIPGPLYLVYAAYFIVFIGWAIWLLLRFYKNANSYVRKRQTQYILFGIGLSAVIGITTNAILPLIRSAQYNVYGTPASILFSLFAGYAITRYRLFDIKFILRNGMFKLVGAILFACVAIGLAAIINELLEVSSFRSFIIILALILVLMQFSVIQIYRKYSRQKTIDLSAISDVITLEADLPVALESVKRQLSATLKDKFSVNEFELMVLDLQDKTYKSMVDNLLKLNYSGDLVQFCKKRGLILINEEFDEQLRSITDPVRRNIKSFMNTHKFGFAIPLVTDLDLYGLVFIHSDEVARSGVYSKNSIAKLYYVGEQFGRYLETILIYNRTLVQKTGFTNLNI